MKVTPIRLPSGQVAYEHKYNLLLDQALVTKNAPAGAEELMLELHCFKIGHPIDAGGLGKYGHFRKVCDILFPDLEWNPWLEAQIQSLCDDYYAIKQGAVTQRQLAWAGAASCGKTFGASLFGFVYWLAAPHETIVVLTSTSVKMIRKRMWPVLQSFYLKVRERLGPPGHIIDSKMVIQNRKGDDKHAISAIAVGMGEANKAAANIQGQHAPRILVFLDEATDVEEAILIAVENLKTNCPEFTLVRIGNAKSRLDPLGKAMEPKDGWNSITVDDEEWLTKEGGLCLHFDGFKSPNVKAGRTLHKHIFSWEDYQLALKEDSKSLAFWMYRRGFPPPDGVSNTVLSEALIYERCQGKHTFARSVQTIAGLDPAFGGDACILYFADMGDLDSETGEDKPLGINLRDRVEIHADLTSKVPRDHQIARKTIELCQGRGVAPQALGVDSTGTGRGVYAILCEEWSSDVHKVEFGGDASEDPASVADPRPCKEVYDRRVTELWFTVKAFVESGLLKGLTNDTETVQQLCSRTYEYKGRRLSIEKKEDYKLRMGGSPDNADALAVLLSAARSLGAVPAGKAAVQAQSRWEEAAKKLDAVYLSDAEEQQPAGLFQWME